MIEFEHVFKSFKKGERVVCLRDAIPNLFKKTTESTFWALQDVSFNVAKGEAVSIIGPNGAGKSTILKIIAGVMEPNKGNVKINGRVSALIEVGAGFHPDLTGRENIYLNGSVMGMTRKEINEKFDSIVDFAGFSEFLDTPVKRYSSGMYLRLGFAVAAHIEPDVLLVDEVLAVGDMVFQRKCLNKIEELRNKNTTILFVSHNLHSVEGICNKAIFLNEGRIEEEGKAKEVIQTYQNFVSKEMSKEVKKEFDLPTDFSSKEIDITDIQFFDNNGNKKNLFFTKEKMIVRVNYFAPRKFEGPIFSIGIIDSNGLVCCVERTKYHNIEIDYIEGSGVFEVEFEEIQLVAGVYIFAVAIFDSTITLPYAYRRQDTFNIKSYMPQIQTGKDVGIFHPRINWKIK